MRRWLSTGLGRATLGASVIAGCLVARYAVSGAEPPGMRDIKDRLQVQAKRVGSLDVTYKLETTGLPAEELAKLADFRNLSVLAQGTYRDAVKGEKRYRRELLPERVLRVRPVDRYGLTPPPPAGPDDPPAARENARKLKEQYDRVVGTFKDQEARGVPVRRTDPAIRPRRERDVTVAADGRSVWERRPRSPEVDEYTIWPAPAPGRIPVSQYLSAAGLLPPDPAAQGDPASQVQALFRLAECVASRPYKLEQDETVGGARCAVLRGSIDAFGATPVPGGAVEDRIWLDRDRGLAVVRRELSRGGEPMERWENSAFREVDRGLWLPTMVRHHRFAADAPAGRKGKPVLTEEIRVEEVKLDGVPDDLFDPAPKPGDAVDDRR